MPEDYQIPIFTQAVQAKLKFLRRFSNSVLFFIHPVYVTVNMKF